MNFCKDKIKKKTYTGILLLSTMMALTSCSLLKKNEAASEEASTEEYKKQDIFMQIETDLEGKGIRNLLDDNSILTIDSSGSILEVAYQDYSGVDFDYADLKSYVETEISKANEKAGATCVSLAGYTEDSGVVKAAINYIDINSYNSFNNLDMVLKPYDAALCDQIVEEQEKLKREQEEKNRKVLESLTEESSEISEDELLEAGFTPEDLESGALDDYMNGVASASDAPMVATFTDAKTSDEVSSENVSTGTMMLIIKEDLNVRFDEGRILYYNSEVELRSDVAVCSGNAPAIIIFDFDYSN